MRAVRSCLWVALASLFPVVAHAADTDKPTSLTLDFGYVQTSGNSDVTTVSGSDKLDHRVNGWLFTQEASAVWGETNGVESAARYGASLRAGRDLSPRLSAFGLASCSVRIGLAQASASHAPPTTAAIALPAGRIASPPASARRPRATARR